MATTKKVAKKATQSKRSLIEIGLRAVSAGFPRKGTTSYPGLVLSWLDGEKQFYCSIATYDGAFGEGKRIQASAKAPTLDGAVRQCLAEWRTAKQPVDELDRVLEARYGSR